MSRIAQRFRRTEVTRAIRAAEAANVEIRPDGTLSILFGQSAAPSGDNEWDKVYDSGAAPIAIRK